MFHKKILAVLAIALMVPSFAFAAETSTTQSTGTDLGLTVSPPLKEYKLDQGKSELGTIKLSNPSKNLVEIYPIIMDFTSKDDTGNPYFVEPEESGSRYSLSSWIKFTQDKIVLAPEQVTEWEYNLIVPDNAGPGGHYGAIMFSNQPTLSNDKLNQVGIASMIASLILVDVSGDKLEQARVTEFNSDKKFYLKAPVIVNTVITNSGNVHIAPSGDVVIKNWLGKTVTSYELNGGHGRILPDGKRKFTITWQADSKPFYKAPIGKYTAELVAVYGSNSQTLNSSASFWMIPLWFIITISALILIILLLIIIAKVRKSKKNRMDKILA